MSRVHDVPQQPTMRDLHQRAMELAEFAFEARLLGDAATARDLAKQALQFESNAAQLMTNKLDAEPTRSILHRSAASLALQSGELREAERLISEGLRGNPPAEIAEELRDLLEQVSFTRHLSLRGVVLEPSEFQLSLAGKGVSFGIAPGDKLIEKLQSIQKLIYRTIDRISHRPFQDNPASPKDYGLFVSTPRAGSFAFSVSIGRPEQPRLPGFDDTHQIVDEVFKGIELLNSNAEEELRELIPDEAYYTNFIALAKRLAPDGEEISLVGFTTVRGGSERQVALTRTRNQISIASKSTPTKEPLEASRPIVTLRGQLLHADSTKRASGQIKLKDEQGQMHVIVVPPGMMSDIVKPLWEETVEVVGRTISKKKVQLEDIRAVMT